MRLSNRVAKKVRNYFGRPQRTCIMDKIRRYIRKRACSQTIRIYIEKLARVIKSIRIYIGRFQSYTEDYHITIRQ